MSGSYLYHLIQERLSDERAVFHTQRVIDCNEEYKFIKEGLDALIQQRKNGTLQPADSQLIAIGDFFIKSSAEEGEKILATKLEKLQFELERERKLKEESIRSPSIQTQARAS